MFLDTKAIKALEAGVSNTWLKQQLHMHNMANVSTVGYKAKNVAFEKVLDKAGDATYAPRVYERTDTQVRPDGNNVNADIESMELYKSYVQYSMLLDKMRGEFSKYEAVLNSNMR